MKNKNLSRRKFIGKSVATSAAMTAFPMIAFSETSNDGKEEPIFPKSFKFSKKTEHLLSLLNIKYPIIQAPTGGAVTTALTAAVASSGGLGALPLTWTSPKGSAKRINAVKKETKGSFFANFVLQWEPEALEETIEAGIKIIQFSWGVPDPAIVAKIKKAGIVLGIQVTSEASTLAALEAGADYLVCQGTEAGGHVHASRPLANALERVLKVARDIPVVASGGIATGSDMKKYMKMGAAGVVMGSRFVATKESGAHPEYKEALTKATADDTVFTVCLNKGWENATHRIIRNRTFEMWEAAGCPQTGSRPGEDDILVTYKTGEGKITRYQLATPNTSMEGKVTEIGMYAGEGVGHINDIPSVDILMKRIWKEFQES